MDLKLSRASFPECTCGEAFCCFYCGGCCQGLFPRSPLPGLSPFDIGLDLFGGGRRSPLALDIPSMNLSIKIPRDAEILTQVSFKIIVKLSL